MRTSEPRPFVQDADFTAYLGDALEVLAALPEGNADAVVTSPPYLDARPEYDSPTYAEFRDVFYELVRVVAGPMLWNVGRVWKGHVEQLWWTDLIHAAKVAGWEHRDTLVWVKPNANPIHGEVFANSHEYVLVFARAGVTVNVDDARRPHAASTVARFGRGWTNHKGVKSPVASKARKTRAEPHPLGALPRSYFEAHVGVEKGNPHPAPMPLALAEHLVRLASRPGQTVLDPFGGSGTTARAARSLGRKSILIEQSPEWCALAARRMGQQSLLAEGAA